MPLAGWNLGGGSLSLLPASVRAGLSEAKAPDIIGLQEVRRSDEGWTTACEENWQILSYQGIENWRGTGIAYRPKIWQVMRKRANEHGSWYRLRHSETQRELWFGVVYVPPHATISELQERLVLVMSLLPSTTLPCCLSGDVNSPVSWNYDEGEVVATGEDGKGRVLLDVLQSQGFSLVPPVDDQMAQPTSRPRKPGARGRRIDWLACKHMNSTRSYIFTDSSKQFGTDHDSVGTQWKLPTEAKRKPRIRLGKRVVTALPRITGEINQKVMTQLAQECSKPPRGSRYTDDATTKGLFHIAKRSNDPQDWKRAQQARRRAHQQWRENKVLEATEGNWNALRECKPGTQVGWETHFAEAVDPQDPHDALHVHYAGIFHKGVRLNEVCTEVPMSPNFSPQELHEALAAGKSGKSVGEDGVSLELLRDIAKQEAGQTELLRWFNCLLHSGCLPPEWLTTVMVLLPKISRPTTAKETRPISISSTTERIFSRMVLQRCKAKLSLQ